MSSSSSSAAHLPIRIYHCTFCSQLLLATTRELSTLPQRPPPALDRAYILPVHEDEEDEDEDEDEDEQKDKAGQTQKESHYTILLSTTIPDRNPVIVRRQDGFDRRRLLRCGRCRLVVAYSLLSPANATATTAPTGDGHTDESSSSSLPANDDPRAARLVCLLPGALVETQRIQLSDDEKLLHGDWAAWQHLLSSKSA